MLFRIILGMSAGGGMGFAYYKLAGCASGTCPLTRKPWVATIYGGVLGVLIATSFK